MIKDITIVLYDGPDITQEIHGVLNIECGFDFITYTAMNPEEALDSLEDFLEGDDLVFYLKRK